MARIVPCFPTKTFNGLAIVGEAPGEQEIAQGIPFVGKSGDLLNTALREAGIDRDATFITNVFMTRPDGNKVEQFFYRRPGDDDAPQLFHTLRGLSVRSEHEFELFRLRGELITLSPNRILLLGNTALWAVARVEGITAWRGKWIDDGEVRVLSTWHPSAVLRNQNDKIDTFAKDIKAMAEALEIPK